MSEKYLFDRRTFLKKSLSRGKDLALIPVYITVRNIGLIFIALGIEYSLAACTPENIPFMDLLDVINIGKDLANQKLATDGFVVFESAHGSYTDQTLDSQNHSTRIINGFVYTIYTQSHQNGPSIRGIVSHDIFNEIDGFYNLPTIYNEESKDRLRINGIINNAPLKLYWPKTGLAFEENGPFIIIDRAIKPKNPTSSTSK